MAHTLPNPFGSPTDAEELVLVKAAIGRITVFGERRTAQGRDVTEAALKTLYEREAELEDKIAATTQGSAVNYAKRMRPA